MALLPCMVVGVTFFFRIFHISYQTFARDTMKSRKSYFLALLLREVYLFSSSYLDITTEHSRILDTVYHPFWTVVNVDSHYVDAYRRMSYRFSPSHCPDE